MSKRYRKILVPLDGSELAHRALPYATELAELAGAQLIILRAVPNVEQDYQMTPELRVVNIGLEEQEATVDHATYWAQRVASELKANGLTVEVAVEIGAAADAIVDYASKHDVDLVVMSTHGRTGLARWAYGSVANKVLTGAPCPVLLVRAQFD
jgi:nucleotide-binding universal stress UspA family protein